MQPDNPQGESAAVDTPEPSAAPQAPGSVQSQAPVNEQPAAVTPKAEDTEALRKELEKVRMEANLHKNKLKEYQTKEDEARKAEMTEVERLKEQLTELENDKLLRESSDFRNEVLNDYLKDDPAVLKAAKALIAKNPLNLAWGEGLTKDEAKAVLVEQLDALKEVVGVSAPAAPENQTPRTSAHANNPGRAEADVDPKRAELIAEATKSGDWSKVFGNMQTMKFQKTRQD